MGYFLSGPQAKPLAEVSSQKNEKVLIMAYSIHI